MRKKIEECFREFSEDDELRRIELRLGDYYTFVFKRTFGHPECWIRIGIGSSDWRRLEETNDFFFGMESVEKLINNFPRIFNLYRSTCQCRILIENINWTMSRGWMIDTHFCHFCPGCGKKLPYGIIEEEEIEGEKPDRFERIGAAV